MLSQLPRRELLHIGEKLEPRWPSHSLQVCYSVTAPYLQSVTSIFDSSAQICRVNLARVWLENMLCEHRSIRYQKSTYIWNNWSLQHRSNVNKWAFCWHDRAFTLRLTPQRKAVLYNEQNNTWRIRGMNRGQECKNLTWLKIFSEPAEPDLKDYFQPWVSVPIWRLFVIKC